MSTTKTSRKQKTEMVREALLEHGRTWSDRCIADYLGISNRTVSNHRKAMESAGAIFPKSTSTHSVLAWPDEVCTSAIEPCPLNDIVYSATHAGDPAFDKLVDAIRDVGRILESIVVSRDGYILSGHRRYAAARHIGMERVPIRVDTDISFADNENRFLKRLVHYNCQRVKTRSELLHEGVVAMDDDPVYDVEGFVESASVVLSDGIVVLGVRKPRSDITIKLEFRAAIIKVVNEQCSNWPLSTRSLFYLLLNEKGLVRNDRLRTPYKNDKASYDDVTDMCARMRLADDIPFESISDETRPFLNWDVHANVGDFIREQLDNLFVGYHRDLLQSQPNHVELLVEKNTIGTQLRRVAAKYTMKMTSARGYISIDPRRKMRDRFIRSGREKLVLICVTDFDPEGINIPISLGESLRDDFDIPEEQLVIIQAALTMDQIEEMGLPGNQSAKESSSRYPAFEEAYGDECWELEAVPFDDLREIVSARIESVLDMDPFNEEYEIEQSDQEELNDRRADLQDRLMDGLDDLDDIDRSDA